MTTNNSDYTITPESVATAGLVSYWRLAGQTPLDQLTAAWRVRALDAKLLPKPPGDVVALGRAVGEEATKHVLIRPLARQGAWAVVLEHGTDTLAYDVLLTVRFAEGGPVFTRDKAAPKLFEEYANRIRGAYDRQRGELDTTDVSAWLVKLARECDAVPLRDTGGIYFVPRPAVPRWKRAVEAIGSVSAHRIFRIPAMKNSEAIDAITDAVTQEAESIVRTMEEELQTPGQLGDRALKNRRKACEELLAKVATYDNLLGVQLKCRERVEGLQAMIAAAALVTDEAAA